MDLVDEKDGLLAVECAALLGLVDSGTNVGYTGEDGIDADEMGARRAGDDVGERRFAGAGWPIEDEGRELVCLDGAPQQSSGPENVVLTDEFFETPWAQPRRQWLFALHLLSPPCLKQIKGARLFATARF